MATKKKPTLAKTSAKPPRLCGSPVGRGMLGWKFNCVCVGVCTPGAYPGGMHRMHVHPPNPPPPCASPPRPCASAPLPSLKGWL